MKQCHSLILFIKAEKALGVWKSGKNGHAKISFHPSSTGRPTDGGTAVRRQFLPPGQGMPPAKITQ
jgi:hypothetical protein